MRGWTTGEDDLGEFLGGVDQRLSTAGAMGMPDEIY